MVSDEPGAGSPVSRADPGALARLEAVAGGWAGPAIVAVWALVEATLLPVVPDVALCLLVLVAPRRAPVLFAALVAGSLAGTAIWYAVAVGAPDAVRSMLLAVPGVDAAMVSSAGRLVASGDPLSIAQLGPGTPLKVYTFAWATGPGGPAALALGVILNRITRIGPGLLLAGVAGWVAPGPIRRHARLVLVAYAALWVIVYALYLG
jgi:hypothetical protein